MMECKVTEASVLLSGNAFEGTAELPVDVDFTLPDYCPDIGRMLKCRAIPQVIRRELSGESLKVEGTVLLEVVYVDGRDKRVRMCEHEEPLNCQIRCGAVPDGACAAVRLHVDYMNCRATGQRRVDVHGAITARALVTAPKKYELLSDAQGAGVRTKKQTASVGELAGRTQSCFTISEALELPDGKPPVTAMVRRSADIALVECKPIANKLIVKGEATVHLVYGSEQSGGLEQMEYVLPFNQFIDMNGADDRCTADAQVSVDSLNVGLRTDSDGEYRRFAVDIRAAVDAAAYREKEITAVTDAYSVDCELELERRTVEFTRMCGRLRGKCAATASLEAAGEIDAVLDAWCEPDSVSSRMTDNGVSVSGNVTVCAIVRDSEGSCEYLERTQQFECLLELRGAEHGRADACVYVNACGYSMTGANRLELRCEMTAEASVFCGEALSCVVALKPDESRMKSSSQRPAVVMYFGESGEELWSIARELGSSVEQIMSDNGLSSDRLEEKRLLLVAAD